jgi:hypothetical protein
MAPVLVAMLLVLGGSASSAQIYEWRDAGGSRNFTNDVEDIPEEVREQAKVFVRAPRAAEPESEDVAEQVASVSAGTVETSESRARHEARERRRAEMARWRAEREQLRREREASRGAQVVYDHSFRFARSNPEPAPVPQVNINIAGPLAVSQVIVPEPAPPVFVEPDYVFGYEPLVSTSFDRGLFRHRTVRMRLQDQFQYDRNGPMIYLGSTVPLGPRFQAKLPRGLRPPCKTSRQRSVLRR